MARSGQTQTAAGDSPPATMANGVAKGTAKVAAKKVAKAPATAAKRRGPAAGRSLVDLDDAAVSPIGGGPDRKVTDCQIINSLARGLKVLSAFGPEDVILTNKDFAVRVGLPKPTVSRLTNTLARLNFLTKDLETGGYRLGEATLALGIAASSQMELPYVARPFMREFVNKYDVGVCVGVRDRLEIRALAYVVADLYDETGGQGGTHMALYARQGIAVSASGFAVIASMPPPERAALFEQLEDFHGPAAWPNIRRRVEFALDDIARSGFCISMREWDRTLNAAATPISTSGSSMPMSLACIGPSSVLSESHIRNAIGPALLDLKHKIIDACNSEGL